MSNHDHQQKLRTAVLSIFPLHKTLFLTKVFFFRGYPTMFQFSRTFQGHDPFSWTFQGQCEPCQWQLQIKSRIC